MAANLQVIVSAVDHASGVLGKVDKEASGLGKTMGTVLRVGALGAAAGIGVAIAAGISFVKQAAEEEAGIKRLAAAVDANGGSWAAQGAAIEKAIQARQKLAFSDDDLRSSLAMLTAQTGSVDEAMSRQTVAMDLARGANIDLGSASKLLGKVTDESHGALSRLGIVVDKDADSMEVMAAVQARFGGQAEAFAGTAAGKWARVGIAFDNIKETIGAALLPLVTRLADKLASFLEENQDDIERLVASFSKWAEEALPKIEEFVNSDVLPTLTDAFEQLKQTIDGAAPVIKDLFAFLSEHKEVALALALALGLVVVAFAPWILAIPAAIVVGTLLLAHWDDIKKKADEIITKIKEFPIIGEIIEAVFSFVKNRVEFWITAAKAVIDIVMGLITGDWDRAWNGIKDLANGILNLFKADVETALNLIKGIFSDAWGLIQNTVITAINGVISAVEIGVNKVIEAVRGLFQKIKDVADAFPGPNPLGNAMQAAIDGMSSVTLGRIPLAGEEGDRLGRAVIDGVTTGINARTPDMVLAASRAADQVTGQMKRAWEVHSPSKVMQRIGEQLAAGLQIGFSAPQLSLAVTGGMASAGLNNVVTAIRTASDAIVHALTWVIARQDVSNASLVWLSRLPRIDNALEGILAHMYRMVSGTSFQHGGFVPAGTVTRALLHGPEFVIHANRMGGMGNTYVFQMTYQGESSQAAAERMGKQVINAVRRELRH